MCKILKLNHPFAMEYCTVDLIRIFHVQKTSKMDFREQEQNELVCDII